MRNYAKQSSYFSFWFRDEDGYGNYGVIEEIEEESHVDIKSELGYEGGQNSGNQSFEEDTEEDTKYEQKVGIL